MTSDNPYIKDIAAEIAKDFSIELETLSPTEGSITQSHLREILAERIAELLDREFEFLMHVFYRLDLNESKVMEILTQGKPNPALALADLVIAREVKKIETRKKYSQL